MSNYKLALFEDDEGLEFVMIASEDYYTEVEPDVKVLRVVDLEGDLTDWPTNRPLSADF